MRIVVIEDNKTLANGLAHQFRDQGHAVDVLNDGELGSIFLKQENKNRFDQQFHTPLIYKI